MDTIHMTTTKIETLEQKKNTLNTRLLPPYKTVREFSTEEPILPNFTN